MNIVELIIIFVGGWFAGYGIAAWLENQERLRNRRKQETPRDYKDVEG